jgi:serine/threonine protein kinase
LQTRSTSSPYTHTQTQDVQAYLLVNQLTKAKDRVRIWLAQVLEKEDTHTHTHTHHRHSSYNDNEEEEEDDKACTWTLSAASAASYVVIKESDARFIRQYGRLWGEDPVSEVGALARVQAGGGHENVVELLACYEGVEASLGMLYMVLPHLAGDELFYLVTEAEGKQGLGEEATRPIFRQVLAGLLHLKENHDMRHGDVSPENVMVDAQGHVTLIDLGMAEKLVVDPPTHTHTHTHTHTPRQTLLEARPRRGKKQYMSPEIYEEVNYDPFAADVWALGAMLYVCWTGCTIYRSPFDAHFCVLKEKEGLGGLLGERERRGSTRGLSCEAKDLLCGMMKWNFSERLTLEEIMCHPWVCVGGCEEEREEEEEEEEEMEQLLLQSFSSMSSAGSSSTTLSALMLDEEEGESEEEGEETDGEHSTTSHSSRSAATGVSMSSASTSSSSSSSSVYVSSSSSNGGGGSSSSNSHNQHHKPLQNNNCDHEDNSESSLQSAHMENNNYCYKADTHTHTHTATEAADEMSTTPPTTTTPLL